MPKDRLASLRRALMALAVGLWAGLSAAAALAAPTLIENRALMTYVDAASGLSSRLESNTVRVVVQPVAALALSAGQAIVRTPGTGFALPHRLTNSGNAAATVRLSASGGAAIELVLDVNGNGVADPGEATVASLELPAGGAADLLLVGTVPASALPGSRLELGLAATAADASASATDTVTVGSGPAIRVTKAALAPNAVPGGEAVFRIVANNLGNGPALGLPVLVDGASRSLVLLRDAIPANATPLALAGGSGQALYHVRETAENVWTRLAPADPATVDAVAWGLERLDPGQAVAVELRLALSANAHGSLENTAAARFDDGRGPAEAVSNTARIALPASPPRLSFFTDANFARLTGHTRLGAPLWVQADAAGCNRDAGDREQLSLTLVSALTGDREVFIAEESGHNTGLYRVSGGVPTADAASVPAVRGDGRLSLRTDDRITATLAGCGAASSEAAVLIDPYGVVFDSKSNAPVAGALVTLIDVSGAGNGGRPGAPATVFAADGITPAPASVTTGADGSFAFPRVPPSDYRLAVAPPGAYTFPSQLPVALMPGGRAIDAAASYGQSFPVNLATGDVHADIPLDAPAGTGLSVRKRAGRERVDIGDVLDYTVEVKNVSGSPIAGVTLADTLPAGFAYVPGSTRQDGRPGADPAGGRGPQLAFSLGSLATDGATTLAYRVRVTALARPGNATNRASATGAPPLAAGSNVAAATVKVEAGIFSNRGFLLGRVFLACDGRPGAAGVKVWLETGDWAVTDAAGQYHFDDLMPTTHVVRLDPATLPAGTAAASRFVDIRNGELRRADFELVPASGCPAVPASPAAPAVPPSTAAASSAPTPSAAPPALESLLAGLAPIPAILAPADGAVLPGTQTAIRLAGPAGAHLELAVNGTPVPASRLGTRVEDGVRGIAAAEYIGVDLKPGQNRLELEVFDPFGNARGRASAIVVAPGPLARIELAPVDQPVADGRSDARLRLRLLDADGVPVAARTALTLEAVQGLWRTPDLDPLTPGVQTFVEGGEAVIALSSPDKPGEVRLRASSGAVVTETPLVFAPALSPLMAVGLVDGVIDLSRLTGRLSPASPADSFEQELRSFGGDRLHGRAALFLKGKVLGDTLLTLAYDSEKPARRELFRDIQPDRWYPVYGDEAGRGFAAASGEKLYLRVDRGSSYVLYGDVNTAPAGGDGPRLARYSRSLTGAKAHLEEGGIKAEAWASQGRNRRIVKELPGTGTSGPYVLAAADLVPGSEQVEIVVRDRDQPGLVVKATPQVAMADYSLEGRRLLFRRPVPSLDADLNPVYVRVTYESDQGGRDFWTLGGDMEVDVTPGLTVGASLADDRNPQAPYRLAGTRARWQLGERTTLAAEVAQSDGAALGRGRAGRVELKHADGPLVAQVAAGRAEAAFDNPASPLSRGREEISARAAYAIDAQTRLAAEVLSSADTATGGRRDGATLSVERDLGQGLRGEAGLRRVHATRPAALPDSPGELDFTSLRGKLTAQVPGLEGASIYGEAEQAIAGSGHLVAAGGDVALAPRIKGYARHEFANSLTGTWGLDDAGQRRYTSVLGIAGEVMAGGQAFSEYRLPMALDGRTGEAAIGLRNLWPVAEGLRLSTGVEQVTGIGRASRNEALALTGGVEWTARPDLKTTARLEWRNATGSESWLATAGAAWKLDGGWALLGKGSFDRSQPKGGGAETWRGHLQAGLAWRDPAGRWLALGRIARLADQDAAGRRDSRLLALHTNLQADPRTEWSGRYAVKHSVDTSAGIGSRGLAQLAGAGWRRDLGHRWDLGLHGRLLADSAVAARFGLMAEVGFRLADNLWVAAGYNALDIRTADLAGSGPVQRGAFLRLRFKFDETLLAGGLPE